MKISSIPSFFSCQDQTSRWIIRFLVVLCAFTMLLAGLFGELYKQEKMKNTSLQLQLRVQEEK